jgi:hypothetical protein
VNILGITLALWFLLPMPTVVQGVGFLTMVEGTLRVVRGATVFQAAEGMRLQQGDILESAGGGFSQLEFTGGAIVALGPTTRVYIFRHGAGGKGGTGATNGDLVLLSGWLKSESSAGAGSYRYQSPMLAASTENGTVVFHCDESGCDVFVESGSATIAEVSTSGNSRHPTLGKTGQFFSRRAGGGVTTLPRPTPAFVAAMPYQFKDTLPSRLAHFSGKTVQPKAQQQVSFDEIRPWLTMPSAWRTGLVDRFRPRLNDSEFRKQLDSHLSECPEWEPILHPEKNPPPSSPIEVPPSESPHPRS